MKLVISTNRVVATLFALFGLIVGLHSATPKEVEKKVRLVQEDTPAGVRLYVDNPHLADITVTCSLQLTNMLAATTNALTATVSGHHKTYITSIAPKDRTQRWGYFCRFQWVYGNAKAQHEESTSYALPFPKGSTFRVLQGFNGKFSHTGRSQFAIDWDMPEGTRFCAMRAGQVVVIKQDSEVGGKDVKFTDRANYILVQQADGTLAEYAHLQKNGALVKLGDAVEVGDVLGFSGNTGYSSGPHLHVAVLKAKNGREQQSLPIRFRTGDGVVETLTEGKEYTAP